MRLEKIEKYSKQEWISSKPESVIVNVTINGRMITLEDSNGHKLVTLLPPEMAIYKTVPESKWEPTIEQVKGWARNICEDYLLNLSPEARIDGHVEGLAHLLMEWAEDKGYSVFDYVSPENLEETFDTDNLLPCPFCGDVAMVFQSGYTDPSYDFLQLETSEFWAVECLNCDCDGFRGYYPNKETAVQQWNRRPQQETLVVDDK